MVEQHFRACVGLIEQLLNCSEGQEEAVLKSSESLISVELLQLMGQVATYLECEEAERAAWLRKFSMQLARRFGIEVEAIDASRTNSITQFLYETLKLVRASQGDSQRIYPVWAQQQMLFNTDLLGSLPQVITQLYEQKIDSQEDITANLFNFARLIQEFPLSIRWINLELSILTYRMVLRGFSRESFPENWAIIQNNLANAYRSRVKGEREENIEIAINLYKLSLEVLSRETSPNLWATTQNHLAIAYMYRIYGEREKNLEVSLFTYHLALDALTREAFPLDWAMTQNNLAMAYERRIRGVRADNLEQAISIYQLALEVRTREKFPTDWAMTQNNLANAYKNRIQGEPEYLTNK